MKSIDNRIEMAKTCSFATLLLRAQTIINLLQFCANYNRINALLFHIHAGINYD